MKNILKYCALAASGMFMFQAVTYADSPIRLNKTISGGTDGKYTITLESYVTGESNTDITETSTPVDLVLVLDVSGSMDDSAGQSSTTYTAINSQGYSYSDNPRYYYLYEGQYYRVNRATYQINQKYSLTYTVDGDSWWDDDTIYYLFGDSSSTTANYKNSSTETIWTGVLYTYSWRTGDYTAQSSKGYSYDGFGNQTLYYNAGTRRNPNYIQVKRNETGDTAYALYFDVGQTRYYLTADGPSTTQPTGNAAVTDDDDDIWTGVLYSRTTVDPSKLDLLQEACIAFIDEIYNKSLGADKTAGTADDVDHRVAIVTYAGSASTKNELTSVQTGRNNLITTINGLKANGSTGADYGMSNASTIISGIPSTRESNKVVLMFTDGEPNHGNGFVESVANAAINNSNTIKGKGATVYTVGIFTGLGDTKQKQVNAYMSYVSSRYTGVTSMPGDYSTNPGKYSPQNGVITETPYYQVSNGSDLKSIFKAIASGSTSGGGTIAVDSSSWSTIDVVSANFTIPSGVEAQGIKVWTETCTAYDPDLKIGTDWKNDGNLGKSGITPVITGNQLTVTGFDYTAEDTWNTAHTQINTYGNWVGNRNINGVSTAAGKRLIIQFNVELNPDYTGGQDMPSNDLNSGLHYTVDGEDQFEPYPVPATQFPSICIMKDGLREGESAVFQVRDGDSNLINTVVLTQKKSNGLLEPCYVVIKKLTAGTYTVTETNWSWAYETTSPEMEKELENLDIPATYQGTYASAKEYIVAQGDELVNNGNEVGLVIADTEDANQVYCVLKEKYTGSYSSDYSNSAISVLFHFTNTSSTAGKPARAEGWSHNRFQGGTATSGGTEDGNTEELDDNTLGGE